MNDTINEENKKLGTNSGKETIPVSFLLKLRDVESCDDSFFGNNVYPLRGMFR